MNPFSEKSCKTALSLLILLYFVRILSSGELLRGVMGLTHTHCFSNVTSFAGHYQGDASPQRPLESGNAVSYEAWYWPPCSSITYMDHGKS